MIEAFKANGSKNAHGVEVVSLVLGIESNNFDSTIRSYADKQGFDHAGVDCVIEGQIRSRFREGYFYYTGITPNREPSQLSSSVRSAFVILNGVTDSVSHAPWEVILNDHNFNSSDREKVLALIDAVEPGQPGVEPTGLTYAEWAGGLAELGEPQMDADGDGLANAFEFYFDSAAQAPNPSPVAISRRLTGELFMQFPVGHDRQGVSLSVEGSADLEDWVTLEVGENAWVTEPGEGVDQVILTLPPATPSFVRLKVEISE